MSMAGIVWLLLLCCSVEQSYQSTKPNIVMIVADDLGWNDISFHGSNEIPTPNIDKLAKGGVILDNYYVLPICSPTRSAIMTGRYPIHTGMQSDTIWATTTWGVGLNETFLPQYLKKQGYATHAVGKWHVGFYAKEYTPRYRGFDSYYGYYLGKSDYWDHSNQETYWGLDLHDNETPVYTQWGNYSTEMYTAEAEGRIRDHNTSDPMFLYLAYQAVHSANTKQAGLQAPQKWIDKFSHIKHPQRRIFAAMVAYMDYGIGRVYDALKKKNMLSNTVIIFTTDNGGPANGFDFNWANNFPLRGVKASLYEGGVRGAGFVYSELFKETGRISKDLIHVTDWLPTIVNLAGGSVPNHVDGVDQWNTLQNKAESARTEVLLNIDDKIWHNSALIMGSWKIVKEGISWDGWYAPPDWSAEPHANLTVKCKGNIPTNVTNCLADTTNGFCLFYLPDDPCEFNNVADKFPVISQVMLQRLNQYKLTMVAPKQNSTNDPRSNPKLYNGVWQPWITL